LDLPPSSKPSPWPGLLIVAAICGAVPAVWNLSQPEGIHRSAFLVVYFVLNSVVPLVAGLLVVAFWKRLHPAEVVLGAICAAGVEAFVELAIIAHLTINQERLSVATEDYLAWGAMFCMFAAGGLFRILRGKPAATNSEAIQKREVLKFATTVFSIVGSCLQLYVLYEKNKHF
jgi:hypothetical protein